MVAMLFGIVPNIPGMGHALNSSFEIGGAQYIYASGVCWGGASLRLLTPLQAPKPPVPSPRRRRRARPSLEAFPGPRLTHLGDDLRARGPRREEWQRDPAREREQRRRVGEGQGRRRGGVCECGGLEACRRGFVMFC